MPDDRETPLAGQIRALIARDGPISTARYMEICLADPGHGYYITRDPIGADGDFITAPEISQMFGELIGLWCVDVWSKMGSPAAFILAELGPGRGTLMVDAMRAARAVPTFTDAARLHLVETSPRLRERQQRALASAGLEANWHESIVTLPEGIMIAIANEFFDALPVRQFERTERGWLERAIALNDNDGLVVGYLKKPPGEDEIPPALASAEIGAVVEVAPASQDIIEMLASRFAKTPGCLLTIDYGHAQSAPGDTLQAVSGHDYAPLLERPGEADLTAHVDFAALSRIAMAQAAAVHGPITQGAFLERLGIEVRASKLIENATPAQARDIEAALARLTGTHGDRREAMGTLFKVMAVTSAHLPAPEPFGM